ncbi:hypothetical protein BLX41_19045 [Pseudomonas protegens]|nr:hypothetical protein BLX41_19045 [Pseudomonas protegens]
MAATALHHLFAHVVRDLLAVAVFQSIQHVAQAARTHAETSGSDGWSTDTHPEVTKGERGSLGTAFCRW